MVELLSTKLFIPPLRPNLVARPRLVQALSDGLRSQRRLTLISAPAGFGKTTLVAAWLKEIGHPAAWLSLDEADNDLPRFLSHLGAAIQLVDEETGAELLNAIQSPQLPPIEKILAALLNEIALRTDPLILVLDDYHLLTNPAVMQVTEFLLQHQPPQLHLALTTREDPDLPLARLRARDQLTEIRARDLRFTQEETAAFLRSVMGLDLSEQDMAVLKHRTEGWAAGLQLAGLSMQKQSDLRAFIADFSGSHRYILDYLTDEVLEQQPEGVRNFLLQTSILERLSSPLCNAVTGRADGAELLAHLEAANLFVIPLDEERRWYRYHHLFADLLRSQLNSAQPDLVPELHLRASRWFEANGDIQAAVEHALQAADLTQAACLIEQHALPKIYQGQVALVAGWFNRLPQEAPEFSPMLHIGKAWATALMRRSAGLGEVEEALLAAHHALDRVKAGNAQRDLVAGYSTSIRAFMLQASLQSREKPGELIALTREAQRLLPADEKAIRCVNAMIIGYGNLLLADLESASLAFRQTLEDGLAGGNYFAAVYGPINLIIIAILQGRLREALQLCDTSIERFNKIVAGQYFPPVGGLYILKGCILLEFNRLQEAEQALTEGLDLVRWTGETLAHKRGYKALARLRAIQGDRLAMLEVLKTLEEAWAEAASFAQAMRHSLLLHYWPEDVEVQREGHFWLTRSAIRYDELEVIGSVDPINVIDFECYLYTAQVLARLAKGNLGAYPLESVQAFLMRQKDFSASHGFVHWVVEIAIAMTLLYLASGKKPEALETLEEALIVAAPTGLLRVFVDECESLQALLEKIRPRLSDEALVAYAGRLLEAMSCKAEPPDTGNGNQAQLSGRELEVLRNLAAGMTYEEIGRQMFLSLNTVQFHIKNIYSKLLVNKRVQAIEKARELNLI